MLNEDNELQLKLDIQNKCGIELSNFKFQIKPNYFAMDL